MWTQFNKCLALAWMVSAKVLVVSSYIRRVNSKTALPFSFLLMMFLLAAFSATGQTTTTFNYTGAPQTYTVPPCVTQIEVVVAGAQGGGLNGGNGATITATIDVTPGEILQINVGGVGNCPVAGWNGGGSGVNASGFGNQSCGGGGASDIQVAPYGINNRIVVAGGGGGIGGGDSDSGGGIGGCATGGVGETSFGSGATGGTQNGGGAGGGAWGGGNVGSSGSLGTGANGAVDPCYNTAPGGGGGGGYYGGGSGGSDCWSSPTAIGGGGGGGGSSLTPAGGSCLPGNNTGNGYVTITPNNEGIELEVNPSASEICLGDEVEITASGAVNYFWTPEDGLNTTTGETVIASPTETTTYLITADDGADCSDTISVTVTVIPDPVISVSPSAPLICDDEEIALTASGADTYEWSPSAGLSDTTGTTVTANPLATQNYTVTGTIGNCSADTTVTVSVSEPPEITFDPEDPAICPGESIEITASGAVSYEWSPATGLNTTDAATVEASPAQTTTYTVTGTDAEGCSSTAEVTTTVLPLPEVDAGEDLLICPGTGIELNGSSDDAISFSWTPTETLDDPTIPNPTATPLQTTTYTLEVTDGNGCANTDEVIVEMLNESYETIIDEAICEGESYTLPDGEVTFDEGSYEVMFTSVLGCDSVVITNLDVHPVYDLDQDVSLCEGDQYTLPDGNTVNSSGEYEVQLQSVNGCDSLITFDITFNPVYDIEIDAFICESQSYEMPDGSEEGTAGSYVFPLSTAAGCDSTITVNLEVQETILIEMQGEICDNENFTLPDGTTVNTAGMYDVVLGAGGCDTLYQVEVTVNPTYDITQEASICQGESFTLPDGTTQNSSGSYPVTFNTALGCDSTVTVELTVLPNFTTNQNVSICEGETYTLPDGTVVDEAGVYPQEFTAANGCDSTANYNISVNPSFDIEQNWVVCDNQNVLDPYGNPITGDGEYFLELTSVNGCDSLVHITVEFNTAFIATTSASICQGEVFGTPGGQVISQAGTYQDVFQTSNGCDSVLVYDVTVLPKPNTRFTASPKVASIYDGPVQFFNETENADSLIWNLGAFGLSQMENPIINFEGQAGFYPMCLTTWNEYGCVDQHCTEYEVREEFTVFIPNAFSPNEDGINDLFYVQGMDIDPDNFHLMIFNRLGELVFESNDPQEKWNGDIKGGTHYGETEVFVYRALVGSMATMKVYEFTGKVSLIR